MSTKRYFVLVVDPDPKKKDMGPSIFYDASSGLKVTSKDEANPDPKEGFEGLLNKKIQAAIKNAHIKEVIAGKTKGKERDTSKTPPAPPATPDLSAMDDEQLLAYYKENWEVKKKDEEKFLAMSAEAKREFLSEDEE